eukprot:7184926-Ditylum_brightwellii.AAC.1
MEELFEEAAKEEKGDPILDYPVVPSTASQAPAMSSLADALLGADKVTMARTVSQLHKIKVIVKKNKLKDVLDSKALHKLRESAEAPLDTKIDQFHMHPGMEE